MKSNSTKQPRITKGFIAYLSRTLALATLGAMGLSAAQAVDFNWDPGQTGGDTDGGLGTWNLLDSNWYNAVSGLDEFWGNTNLDKAIFGNTGGLVTISTGTGVIANAVSFTGAGYTLAGAVAGDVLTLDGATPTISVSGANTATINAGISGTVGFTKSGTGTLVLGGTSAVSGGVSITGGTVRLGLAGALTTDVTVGTGALLETNLAAPVLTNGIILNGGTYRYGGLGQNSITALKAINLTGDGTINLVNSGVNGKLLLGTGQLVSSAATTLTKTGNGVLQLSGPNTGFQSNVVVSGGLVEFQNADAFGTGTQTITMNSGVEFVASNTSVRHNFTLNTGAILSANGPGGGDYSGALTLNGATTLAPRLFQAPTVGTAMRISGTLAGTGALNVTGVNPTLQAVGAATGVSSVYLTGNNAGFGGTFNIGTNGRIEVTGAADSLGAQQVNFAGGTLAVAPDLSGLTGNGFATAGLFGRYYNNAQLGSALIGGFDNGLSTPAATRTDTTINFGNFLTGGLPAGPANTNLGISWAGSMKVTTGGVYAFNTNSDDGSMIYVDGVPVAANDFPQGPTTRGGSVNLSPGYHSIVIKYAQGGGGTTMIANYSGPDTANATVVLGSAANVFTSNGTGNLGSATIDNPLALAAGQSGNLEAVSGNVTSTGTLNIGNGAIFGATGQTGSELITQSGAVTLNGRANIQVGGTGQSLAFAATGADLTISGDIGETTPSSILKTGGRTLTLTGAYNWTGSTTLAGGFLGLNKPLPGGALTILNNGLNNANNAGVIGSGTFTVPNTTIYGASAGTNTFSGTLDLGGSAKTITVWGLGNTVIGGTLSNGDLVKAGLGTMTASTANAAFTGGITVNNGRLVVTNVDGLGAASTGTTVNSGGILEIANITVAEPLTLNGRGQPTPVTAGAPGAMYSGALVGSGGTAGLVSGAVTLGSNSAVGVAAGSALTISGVISDGGSAYSLTKTLGTGGLGANPTALGVGGTLVLTGVNTYTGATIIEAGELRLQSAGQAIASTNVRIGVGSNDANLTLGGSNQMPSSVILDFNNANRNSKFNLNGFNQTVAGFANTSYALPIIQNFEAAGAGTSVLTVNNPTDTSFNGLIRNQTGTLALTKAGAGTLTLSGNGMFGTGNIGYTGPTLITAGKLIFSDSTSTIGTPITISGTGSLEFNESMGRSTIYAAALNDGGLGFTKTGKGNLTINTVGTVTGTINVNEGILNLTDAAGNVNPLPGAPINVAAGAQVQMYGVTAVTTTFNNNITLNGMSQGGALSGSVVGGTPTNTFTGTLTLNATSNISTGWSDKTMNWTGAITGAGGLVFDKLHFTQNPGVFNLTNTGNNYAGSTTINTGTVQFTTGALPSGNLKFGGTFGNGGNFGTGQLVLSAISGSSFTRALGTGANQVQFTGDGGGFSAIGAAATVNFGGAGAAIDWQTSGGFDANSSLVMNMGTGANNAITVVNDINLNSGVRRIVDNTNNMTYSGIISGTSELILEGAGQHRFIGTGANTYTGLTNLTGGTLALNRTGGNAIAGDIQISSNLGGTRRIVYLGANEQISDTATLSFLGQANNNGDLRLFGFSETVGAIQDRSGGGVIEVAEVGETGYLGVAISTTATSTLTLGGNNSDSFYNGFFRNNGGNNATATGVLNVVKNGTGTFTLSAGQQSGNAAQTYSGVTTINGGMMVFNNIGTYNSPIAVNTGANVGFNTNVNQSLTDGQVISGAGNLVKSGTGTMILSGANAYSGTTTVNNGILQITGTTNASHNGAYTVNSGGILVVGNGTNGGVLTANNAITVNAGGVAAFSRNNGYNFSGIISGAGDVQSRAGGTATILSGANDYSGATTMFPNTTLALAGNGASAGGLNVTQGSTLTLDFNLAGSNSAGIVASTAAVNLSGGTLAITGSAVANTQTLGAVTLGTTAIGGFVGLTPSVPSNAAANINLTSGAGGLTVSLGAISHVTGGTANIALPSLGTVTTSGTAIGGIANGFTTTSAGTTWLAQDGGGVLTALATYGADTFGAGLNTDVTITGAGASTNSVRFNTASANTVTLTGANVIDSGGILMTAAVGGNLNTITGGSLAGSSTAGLTVIQNNNAGLLNIASVIENNGGATGLTKAGTGALALSGANTYSGPTVVSQGALVLTGSLANSTVTTLPAGTLVVGDGTGVVTIPTLGVNAGSVQLNDGAARTISSAFNVASNFNSVSNAISNGTSYQTGNFTKLGSGTLTITAPLAANTFHQRAGTTILDTGANVISNGFNSIGLGAGDVATLTVKGAGRITQTGDFNVADVNATGTLNLQDQGVITAGNYYIGKAGTAAGATNQTLGSIVNAGGSQDWRIGGSGSGADSAAYGIHNISGGTFQTARNFQIGSFGRGVFNQTGGAVSVTGGTPDTGRFAGSFGLLNVSNGTFTHNTTTNLISGENGTGVMNVSGTGQLIMANVATANIGLALGGAGATGTVNLLSGGLIQVGMVRDFDASTATQSNFNFNGGTLRVTTATANAATFMTGLTAATVYSGGANIDTNGVATTIAQPLLAPTAGSGLATIPLTTGGSGYIGEPIVQVTGGGGTGATARAIVSGGAITGFVITNPGTGYSSAPTINLLGGTGIGGVAATVGTATTAANATTGILNKLGAGTLTLTGAGSTYGGDTTVSGGTLTLNGQTATITSPGITFGSTVAYQGSNVVNGTGVFNYDNVGATAALAKVFTGNLTFAQGEGTLQTTRTAAFDEKLTFANFSRTGNATGNIAPANAGSATNGVAFTTAPTAGAILSRGLFFGGANYATYDAGGFARALAYGTDASTTTSAAGATLTGPGAAIHTNVTGAITAQTTNQFSTVKIGGAFNVTLAANQTLTADGILKSGANSATISGGTALTSSSALLIARADAAGDTLIINTPITGAGVSLVKSGAGILQLGATTLLNTYGGETVVNAGTLKIGITESIPNNSNVTIHTGATLDLNNLAENIAGLSGVGTVGNTVAGTPTLTVGNNNASSVFGGSIVNGTGNVALTKTGTGTLTLTGATHSYTGATTISNGAIALAVPNALANNTQINVNTANGLQFDTTIPVISALGGNGNIDLRTRATAPLSNAPVQLSIGNNNVGATYSGAFTGSGTVIKIGTGTEILSGNNTHSGGIVANAGILGLSGNNQSATGAIYANNGGTIALQNANSLIGASGRNVVIANGGVVSLGTVSANPTSTGFANVSSFLSRIDSGSSGVLALSTDGSLQAPVTENLDFSSTGPGGALNVSLGAVITANSGFGTAPVQYTGVITPNSNTFRIGGGNGRIILPNSATLAGANNLILGGGNGATGQVFLTANYGFTGSTLVNSGTNYVTNLGAGGSGSSIGAGSSAASNLVLNGGNLTYIGAGASTDRLFTLSTTPSALDSSGAGPVNFTNTGAVGFLNSGNRTLIVQGTNTGANMIAASFGDSVLVTGANGTLNHGITTLQKNGNGTWILSGNNTFSGGANINNGVLQFNSAASIGANTVNGPASVLVNAAGAVAFGGSLTTGIQATLNRISPLSTGTVALTADSAEAINFDGGAGGAQLSQAYLGAYGNASYTGTLTPFGSIYRLGGGGGVLTLPNGGLTGPRQLFIGGGGPGAGFVNNPNLNGNVVLGGTSDYSGGTIIQTGAILSATSVTALGSGPLKFQGGVYRAVDSTDITLASDGTSAREIRIGLDTSASAVSANVDVVGGVTTNFSKTFGIMPALGSNQGQSTFTKFGGGTLVLANGINLGTTGGQNNVATNSGTLIIERGTLSILANPTNYVGNIQVGSNNGGVATLKLGANNVFANTTAQFAAASVVDLYTGSKLDLNGFNDTIRNIRGMGSIVNSGSGSPTLTTGTVAGENIIFGGNLVGNFVLKRAGNIFTPFGTTFNSNGIEIFNNYNPNFTGKLVADSGMIRVRADGTLGSTTEALVADKITLNNGSALLAAGGNPLVLGANRGITIGRTGGSIWSFGSNPLIVNGPITGAGSLTVTDDAGMVFLGSDNNTYAGGTVINSNAAGRGILVVGAGGATGSLPAGDVFFNSGAGLARLMFFKSTDMTVANSIYGPGVIHQIGAGTTTLSGMNNNSQTTIVQGGKLRADFSGGNQPIGSGTALQIAAGTFEYVAPAGDNTLRLGTLTATNAGNNNLYASAMTGGGIGDSTVQSTYGGSGIQSMIFSGFTRGTAGVTTNFAVSGGVNGTTNSIGFTGGVQPNNALGAAFFFGGSEFAAYDQNGYVRAVQGTDFNATPDNTVVGGRYLRLTAAQTAQASVAVPGINLSGSTSGFALAASQALTLNGNPGTLLKSGGGTASISGAAGASVNNNAQELIVRTDAATDVLSIDVPISGTGAFTKSGLGQLTLTAANNFTGTTLINSGTILVTGNGALNLGTSGSEIRIANAAGQSATLTIDSATANISTGNTANALRIGEAGNATLNQSAGTVTAARHLAIGESLGATGTYNLSGGTLNVKTDNTGSYQVIVGRAGTGTMNISGNSVVNILNGAQLQLAVGTVNPAGFQTLIANNGVSTGVGLVNQTGGTVNVATNNGVYQSQIFGGVVVGVDGTGTYTLNGGTLNTPQFGRGHGTGTFNLGSAAPGTSGTLRATSGTMNVTMPINLTGTGADKGTIDTNANDLTFTGALTGAGGFKKASNGVLNLLGSGSTYGGGTDITGGSIVASGTSLGTGVVNVGSGTTLQVQGQQKGLLGSFYITTLLTLNPAVTTGSAAMSTEFASLENLNAFTAGKNAVAIESTAARGKVSVNYLELGGANGNTALPPAVLVANGAGSPFLAQLGGKFNAATGGEYTFQTRSDDNTGLWIDGQPVLDNNRDQGQVTRTGTVNLSAGLHDIVVAYRQGAGGGGFSIGVTQPGQGQSFQIGNELNMSNDLLSFGSNDITVGGLAGAGTVNTVTGGTVTDNNSVDADFSGVLNGNAALVKAGLGKQILSGNNAATFSGAVSVTGGNLEVSGSLSGSAVTVAGGTLGGDGTVGAVTVTSGTVAPGNSTIGSLDTANFGLTAGTLSLELNSVSAYDSINTTGTVSLGGNLSLSLGVGPFLNGDTFLVLNNDGVDAVNGTFAGIAEGGIFSASGYDFTVSYVGGDGNDVTLLVPEPGSAVLLLGGLAMLAGRRRRNNRA